MLITCSSGHQALYNVHRRRWRCGKTLVCHFASKTLWWVIRIRHWMCQDVQRPHLLHHLCEVCSRRLAHELDITWWLCSFLGGKYISNSVTLLVRKVWLRTHRAHRSCWLLNRPQRDVVAVASAFLVCNGEHRFWGRRFDADMVTFRRKDKRKSRKFLRHPIIFLIQWVYRAYHKVS